MLKYCLLPALLACATPLIAQTATSFELFDDATPTSGYAIVTGDFNSDGIPDYVTGGSSTALTLRLGNGDGTFRPAIAFGTAGQSPQDLATADLNNDGHTDLVVTSYQGVSVYFGKGDGTFTTGPVVTSGSAGSLSTAVGDFNNDGLADIAVGLPNGSIQIYSGVGGTNFVLTSTIAAATPNNAVFSLRAADVDGNGTIDLAYGDLSNAYLLWGNGKGGFTPTTLKNYPSAGGVHVSVGDLNQDSHADVLVETNCSAAPPAGHASSTCTNVDVFYGGQGTGKTFYRNALSAASIGVYGSPVLPVDINGDGIADLAISARDQNGSQEGMFFYLGQPDGSFNVTPERYIITSEGVGSFALADFNRDGMMDAIAIIASSGHDELFLNATIRPACATSMINPTVTVCSPVDGTYSRNPVVVRATAFDTTQVTALQLYQDGSLVYNTGATSYALSIASAAGKHLFVAKAFDAKGVSFRSDRTIFVYSGNPGAVCPVVANGASLCVTNTASPLHVIGNGNTAYVPTSAQLYVDGSLLINKQDSSTAIDTTLSLPAGSHLLVFKLFDAYGNVAVASRTVTIN